MKSLKILCLGIATFCSGCASYPKLAIPVAPLGYGEAVAANNIGPEKPKVNLCVVKSENIVSYHQDSTSLDLFWSMAVATKQRPATEKPKFVTEGDFFKAYKESLENAVRGAGFEISPAGRTVTVTLHAVNCGLYGTEAPTLPQTVAAAAINSALIFSGIGPTFIATGKGGHPGTVIFSIASEGERTLAIPAKATEFMGFESMKNYKLTINKCLNQTQAALVSFIRGQ